MRQVLQVKNIHICISSLPEPNSGFCVDGKEWDNILVKGGITDDS